MKHFIRMGLQRGFLFLVVAVVMMTGCQQKPDASQQLKPIVDKYVAIWNSGNYDELSAIIDPHFVRHANLQPNVEGLDGIKKVISGFRTAYPDVKITVNDEVYSGGESAGLWTFTGTNSGAGEMPPTGKSVKIWGVSILHFANGKLVEEWVAFDNQSLMTQLGYTMTPPSGSKP